MKPSMLAARILVFYLTIIGVSYSNRIQKSGHELSESSTQMLNKIQSLESEIAELKSQLQNCRSSKDAFNPSSFLEMTSQLKTDPAFKAMINFPLPRDTSYIGLPGEKNNQKFGHIKLCTPGCIVGGS